MDQPPEGLPRGAAQEPYLPPGARTRRGFLGALLAALSSALVIALLWLLSRGAPSAGRDPNWTMPAPVPTNTPEATP